MHIYDQSNGGVNSDVLVAFWTFAISMTWSWWKKFLERLLLSCLGGVIRRQDKPLEVFLRGVVSPSNEMVTLLKFSWIWAFFIANCDNNDSMSDLMMSVLWQILRIWIGCCLQSGTFFTFWNSLFWFFF